MSMTRDLTLRLMAFVLELLIARLSLSLSFFPFLHLLFLLLAVVVVDSLTLEVLFKVQLLGINFFFITHPSTTTDESGEDSHSD
jgi:hypothetical protein